MRAVRHMKRPSRAWRRMENSIEHNWLTDQATFLERVKSDTPGTHGTPGHRSLEFGPFAAKLSEPRATEQHQPDRELLEGSMTLAVMSDRRPKERQLVRVVDSDQPENSGVYRIEATVNPRPAPWGISPIYNLEVVRTDEY